MIEAVIFDMDGLMFDTENIGVRTWNEAAVKYGKEEINDLIWVCIGTNRKFQEKLFAEKLGEDFPYDEFHDFVWTRRDEILENEGVPIKEGLIELLEYLKENKIKTAVATSTNRDAAKEILRMADVLKYFDCITTGDETKNGKPAPDIFLLACSKLGVEPQNAMGLEDSFNGIRALNSAGMVTVMVPDLIKPTEEILNLCDRCIDSLNEVKNIIETINR